MIKTKLKIGDRVKLSPQCLRGPTDNVLRGLVGRISQINAFNIVVCFLKRPGSSYYFRDERDLRKI
jgi:hypothetical protein